VESDSCPTDWSTSLTSKEQNPIGGIESLKPTHWPFAFSLIVILDVEWNNLFLVENDTSKAVIEQLDRQFGLHLKADRYR